MSYNTKKHPSVSKAKITIHNFVGCGEYSEVALNTWFFMSEIALFHIKTLNKMIQTFAFPSDLEARHEKLKEWVDLVESNKIDQMKEVSLHGQYLNDIFQQVLGYRPVTQAAGNVWDICAEQTVDAGGGSADAALGIFTSEDKKQGSVKLQGRVIAPIELKGSKNDLDRAVSGRKESAVVQGWRYANYTPDCKWVIVSNYRELRLYQTSKTPAYYERFITTELKDLETFKRFYFLLCRQNFLPFPSDQPSRIDRLLEESNDAQIEITNLLYQEYKQIRVEIARYFRTTGAADIPNRETVLIEKAQKVLDRILFIAFCEDRGLLPQRTLRQAHDYQNPYNPRSIWENYKAVFRSVDKGNDALSIPGYNGGLFAHDLLLDDQLQVTDLLCSKLKDLTRFEFDTEISVDILGHIFEQSVTDLEELRALAAGEVYDQKKGKRKTQGVFYTPAYITQYIVEVALGGYLSRGEQALRDRFQLEQIPDRATRKKQDAEIQFWEAYRDEVLLQTRVIDPACGSGAFLIAAFDYLSRQYERVNQALAELKSGQRSVFDLNKTILNNNLYGVDLSPESVEITKLSLWLKTAERGKPLTYLDDNIQVGNSIVHDPQVTERAFDWQSAFSQVFAKGGFDVAIGNPPYVRQELLSPIKPYLQQHYESYDGVADLYTYFYEKGLKILKPDGVLSYIVTNKWLRSGYGEPLRRFFAYNGVLEQIIDFGHAPIFEDADTFPCIVVARKPQVQPVAQVKPQGSAPVVVCPVPREKLADINLLQYVGQEGYKIPWSRFTENAWSLERPEVDALMAKIRRVGVPLKEFAGVKPYRGILTGFNEAFLIDDATKKRIVQADPKCAEIIKPFLRGQDIKRWAPIWNDEWLILLKSSHNHKWAWSEEEHPEEVFSNTFPSVYQHLKHLENKLRNRTDQGRYWWELRSCSYYNVFSQPKLTWKDLSTYSEFCFDKSGIFTNDLCFILSSSDFWLLGVLNSPLMWYYLYRTTIHGANETLRLKNIYTENIPIAPPTDAIRAEVEPLVSRLIELTKTTQEAYSEVLNWLATLHSIDKPGQKLENFASLDATAFVQEVKKRRPKSEIGLRPSALKEVRQVYDDYAPAIQSRRAQALQLEHRLSDLVNQAYQLTPEEIDLMWKTAPPRMPISSPQTTGN